MSIIKVEHFGFEGIGRTVKEAREAAAVKVRAFVNDSRHGAKVLKLEGAYVVISRNPESWQYQIIWPDGLSGTVMLASGGSQKEVEKRARVHVAQVLCSIPDRPLDHLIGDKQDLAEYRSWFDWQCRYKEAKEAGYSDDQARDLASNRAIVLSQRQAEEEVSA